MTPIQSRILEIEIRQRWRYSGEPDDRVTAKTILQSTPTGYDREIFTPGEYAMVTKVFAHARHALTRHGVLVYCVALKPPSTAKRPSDKVLGPGVRSPECGCCHCKAVRSGALALQ